MGALGHVKQYLNPGLYSTFKRRLKHVASPAHIPIVVRPSRLL
jgi:hypothetical protein